MAIVLGNHVFDETRVKVEEKHEEIGGRDARVVGIRGVIEADDVDAALDATVSNWSIAASGAMHAAAAGGNVFSWPVITITAAGDLVRPTLSDGVRSITYDGTLGDGESLVFDAPAARVTLDGEDVTPYVSGAFPQIHPDGTTLVYTDDAASSHTASATISWHNRWW